MTNVLFNRTDFTVKVNKQGGRLVSTTPITVKNQIQEIRAIDDVPKVNTALKVDGSTLIYNATTGYYDVRLPDATLVLEVDNLYVDRLWANNNTGTNGQVLFTNGNTTYWANTLSRIIAGTGLAGGGQGSEVTLSVNSNYITTITVNNALFANTANTALYFDGIIDSGAY
jgi:hypothetical protein